MSIGLLSSFAWIAYAAAAAGCAVVLHAGRIEARGELERAAARARRGGFLMCGAALVSLLPGVLLMAGHPDWLGSAIARPHQPIVLLLPAGQLVVVLAGFVGLLAGLTGKPRPSGYAAALLLATGLVMLGVALAADP